jgi:hypothetical protein
MGAWLYRNKNQNSQTPSCSSDPFFSSFSSRLLKNRHLLRYRHPSSLRRTAKYVSLLRISGALHLAFFEQPGKDDFLSSLLG